MNQPLYRFPIDLEGKVNRLKRYLYNLNKIQRSCKPFKN